VGRGSPDPAASTLATGNWPLALISDF